MSQTAAEYPMAQWIPAHASNYRERAGRVVTQIVIHVTDGHAAAQPVAEMWQQAGHGTSAHFVVGQDATVLQCVKIEDVAQHAHTANGTSVGIEHCARTKFELGHDDPGMPPTAAQYEASAELVVWLLQELGIPCDRQHVLGHAEADPHTTHSDCPTGAWDWSVYWPIVQQIYKAGACE